MARGIAAWILLACGCSPSPTSLLLDLTAEDGFNAPSSLTVKVWDATGPLVRGRSVSGSVPGTLLLIGLPDRDQSLRLALADPGGVPLAGVRAAVRAHQQAHAQMVLHPQATDDDSDGVPNEIDDCPDVADPEQTNSAGQGAGDACAQLDLAVSTDLPSDLPAADLARADLLPTADLTPAPLIRVSQTSGLATLTSGNVQVTPPAALPGDLVVLLIDRYFANSPFATAGWTSLGSQMVDGDTQEAAWRVAASDEQTNASRYTFASPGDASWALVVYRNVTTATSTHSTAAFSNPFTMPALAVSSAPALVIDALATDNPNPCMVAGDLGGYYFQTGIWHVVELPVLSPSTAGSQSFDCSASQAALFQIRIDR